MFRLSGGSVGDLGSIPGREGPLEKELAIHWQPTPVFLPGESHGQRNLGGLESMGLQRVGHE